MILQDSQLTKKLVAFALETAAEDVPEIAMESGKRILLDSVGVALAASKRPVGRIIMDYVKEFGGNPQTASVIGGGFKAPPSLAALANGTLTNALDFDEGLHVVTHVLPTALAMAEHVNCSGRDLLAGFVIGYEVGTRLTSSIDALRNEGKGPTRRGWWHVGLVGPIAAAATASRFLGLDAQQSAMALGIATTGSGGFRRNMGTMAKALHSGNAASDGIRAAQLAQRGFTGDPAIIESPLGFMEAICLPDERDPTAITERMGKPYAFEGPPRIKAIPACTPAHAMIDVGLAARSDPAFDLEAIESVAADLHPFSLLRPEPEDEDAAGFSGAYLLATALAHGAVELSHITDEAVQDTQIRALMKRISHQPPETPGIERIVVRLRGGRELITEIPQMSRRLTKAPEIVAKFLECTDGILAPAAAQTVRDLAFGLDGLADINGLMTALRETL
jgi:2-methylcitrate dehydratase PrpD